MPPVEMTTRIQKINKSVRILVTKGGSYPPNLQGNTSKQEGVKVKKGGHQRSSPCLLSLKIIKQALQVKSEVIRRRTVVFHHPRQK
jgi:hypothetical protein